MFLRLSCGSAYTVCSVIYQRKIKALLHVGFNSNGISQGSQTVKTDNSLFVKVQHWRFKAYRPAVPTLRGRAVGDKKMWQEQHQARKHGVQVGLSYEQMRGWTVRANEASSSTGDHSHLTNISIWKIATKIQRLEQQEEKERRRWSEVFFSHRKAATWEHQLHLVGCRRRAQLTKPVQQQVLFNNRRGPPLNNSPVEE